MGIVLLGRDPDTDEHFAIKMIKPELVMVEQLTHRFVKEAGHMQRLKHANVMPVLEVSDRPHGPYFVMPYFEKGSLVSCIQPGRPMGPEQILDIASQIAEGLRYTHQHGIIHRDLKPANILLAANGRVCLADFGLARTMFNDSVVDAGSQQCEGTAPYMSPAVAAGGAEDTRCDIYAFGALLYEMLTGEPPYKGSSTKEIQNQILAGPPTAISVLNPKADGKLISVAEGAMARELRDRYADMADVLADLVRIKDGKAPAGPRGITAKARQELRRFRRIPMAVWIPAILVIFAALGLILRPTTPKKPLFFSAPRAVAVDNSNNIYVADGDSCTVLKITPAGILSTLAGKANTPGIVDATGADARFSILRGATIDGSGMLYAGDTCMIRRVTQSGEVSTLAGMAGKPGSADGVGEKARFAMPSGIAVDTGGTLYVADMYTIRRITQAGVVSTLAGTARHAGAVDGEGSAVRFSDQAKGIAVDNSGNVFVADTANNSIRKITPAGVVSTIAGIAGATGGIDGVCSKARFFRPQGIAVDSQDNVYIADTENDTIRKITAVGEVSTLAGSAQQVGNSDGVGKTARFSHPEAITVDSNGNLYVADTGNHVIRKLTASGDVTTLVGVNSGADVSQKN